MSGYVRLGIRGVPAAIVAPAVGMPSAHHRAPAFEHHEEAKNHHDDRKYPPESPESIVAVTEHCVSPPSWPYRRRSSGKGYILDSFRRMKVWRLFLMKFQGRDFAVTGEFATNRCYWGPRIFTRLLVGNAGSGGSEKGKNTLKST
jgi:hypothetical protein